MSEYVVTDTPAFIQLFLSIFSGCLSLIGSMTLVVMHLRSRKVRLSSTYGRLIFGMSFMDIFQSTAFCFSSTPAPENSNGLLPSYGTTSTCTIQGLFLYTGGIGTTLYYCMLCIYYVFSIQIMSDSFMKKNIEPFLHALPLLYSIPTGIFLAASGSFNSAGVVCWISPVPWTCREDNSKCTRGKNAFQYRLIFQGIPIILSFIIIFTCMIFLIFCLTRRGNNTKRDEVEPNSSGQLSSLDSPRRKMIVQALLYIAAYFCTFIFTVLFQAFYMYTGKSIRFLYLLQLLTAPAQGFFNFIVYIRPSFISVKQKNQGISMLQAITKVINSSEEEKYRARRRKNSSCKESIESMQSNLRDLALQNSIDSEAAVQPESKLEESSSLEEESMQSKLCDLALQNSLNLATVPRLESKEEESSSLEEESVQSKLCDLALQNSSHLVTVPLLESKEEESSSLEELIESTQTNLLNLVSKNFISSPIAVQPEAEEEK